MLGNVFKICSRIVMLKQLELLSEMIHEILMNIVLVRFMNCHARQCLKIFFNNCHAKIVGISE